MGGIFISYRRGDSAGYAGRLSDHLRDHFGRDRVFMDIETIEIGEDFVEALNKAVSSCAVLIAVIGPSWSSMTDAAGRRRLEEPNDYTRLEISAALERKIRVVPVLVQDAVMPKEDDLPDTLKTLVRRQALRLSNESWDHDVNRLCEVLERDLGIAPSSLARRLGKPEPRRPAAHDARRGYLIGGTLLVAAVVTGILLFGKDWKESGQSQVSTGANSAAGGATSTVTDRAPPAAEEGRKSAKRPKAKAPQQAEAVTATALPKAAESEKAAPPSAVAATAAPTAPQAATQTAPQPPPQTAAEQNPSQTSAAKSDQAAAATPPPKGDQPAAVATFQEKPDTTAMATPPAKPPEPAPKPAKPQLYTVNTSQDKSTVIIVGAGGKEKEHISLDPDRVQKIYQAPDGKWGVVVFKVRNEEQYGALPLDLTEGRPLETVKLPSLPEGVKFEGHEAVLNFAAGQNQRIALP